MKSQVEKLTEFPYGDSSKVWSSPKDWWLPKKKRTGSHADGRSIFKIFSSIYLKVPNLNFYGAILQLQRNIIWMLLSNLEIYQKLKQNLIGSRKNNLKANENSSKNFRGKLEHFVEEIKLINSWCKFSGEQGNVRNNVQYFAGVDQYGR